MSFSESERHARELHEAGFTGLKSVPDWPPLAFAEAQHGQWSATVIRLLSEANWCVSTDGRPGDAAAEYANNALRGLGANIWVSTTHPSAPDMWEADEYGGPRWYVSIIEAAWQQRSGCCDEEGRLPPLPPTLVDVLWPNETDGGKPWLTELGWTVVPPHSSPQQWHADIVRCEPEPPGWIRSAHGRFHHIAFKADRTTAPTTEGVRGAFDYATGDERIPHGWADARVETMTALPCVLFDSELVHRAL